MNDGGVRDYGEGCDHRQGTGCATASDLERYGAGQECTSCGCTLGADGYWYVDAADAPRGPARG